MGSSVRECSHHLRWFSTHDDKSLHAIHRKYDRRNVGALALYGRALRNSDAQLLKLTSLLMLFVVGTIFFERVLRANGKLIR